ncbi:MAG TPA: His-Xaa-Ser system radical SAM maturase HxsB [Thermoanaerobaculia bacterium]|jgi:His-Xaa-Ser system radical SAM maturase HxsB|nr:His-Xaa-Ser system radical SAM maturase HxsB [Thermoanaerobaculia bacterium]
MSEYRLLPFRFLRLAGERMLLVNETGEHHFATSAELSAFVHHELPSEAPLYADLKAKHFLFDSGSLAPFELLVAKYRTRKSALDGFTRLNIFVVSLRCEHSCHYCQVSRVSSDRSRYDMSEQSARRALDLVFRSPAPELKIELQGGEPLLHFERVRQIVVDAEARAEASGRRVEFVVTSNLALLDDAMLEFFRQHRVLLSTSLDGPADIHNANRPRPGNDSHARVVKNLARAREVLGREAIGALATITRRALDRPRDVVDEYVRLGFSAIFLRPLSPYGFALRSAGTIGYSTREFLDFYVRALDYLIELNARGTFLVETYAQLLLTRMLTPFPTGYVDLQSPAGAGIGAVVYNYDGDVYASDEARMLAEMGDHRFRLGNVHRDDYAAIFGGATLRTIAAASVIESTPGCADCAFQSWCGADPVLHYATQGDVVPHVPTSAFHEKHFLLFRHLLELYENDPRARRVFWSWIRNEPLEEVA